MAAVSQRQPTAARHAGPGPACGGSCRPRRRRCRPVGVVVASFPFWTGRLYPEDESSEAFRGTGIGHSITSEHRITRAACWCCRPRSGPLPVGRVHDNLFDGLSPLSPVVNSVAAPGDCRKRGPGRRHRRLRQLHRLRQGHARADTRAARRALGPAAKRPRLAADHVPRPSTYDALRADPDLRIAATFGRPGKNTAARRHRCRVSSESTSLPPVELYEVAGSPSPQPRLAAGPPLLVAGGGESWPSLATRRAAGRAARRLHRSRRRRRSERVGRLGLRARRHGRQPQTGHRGDDRAAIRSPTLAAGEPTDRAPGRSLRQPETQSVATYADARRIFASRSGNELRPSTKRRRAQQTPSIVSNARPGQCGGRSTPPGSRLPSSSASQSRSPRSRCCLTRMDLGGQGGGCDRTPRTAGGPASDCASRMAQRARSSSIRGHRGKRDRASHRATSRRGSRARRRRDHRGRDRDPRRTAGSAGVRAHPGRSRDPSRLRRPPRRARLPRDRRDMSCDASIGSRRAAGRGDRAAPRDHCLRRPSLSSWASRPGSTAVPPTAPSTPCSALLLVP